MNQKGIYINGKHYEEILVYRKKDKELLASITEENTIIKHGIEVALMELDDEEQS